MLWELYHFHVYFLYYSAVAVAEATAVTLCKKHSYILVQLAFVDVMSVL
jgi:hypothetical protein